MRLSGGDMRKVLNILESCSLAYKDISLAKIYEVTGRPSPDNVEQIYQALTTMDFSEAFKTIYNLKMGHSLSTDDIVRELHSCVIDTGLNDQVKMFLINRLAEIEYRLSQGSSEKAQIASLVGAFIEIRGNL